MLTAVQGYRDARPRAARGGRRRCASVARLVAADADREGAAVGAGQLDGVARAEAPVDGVTRPTGSRLVPALGTARRAPSSHHQPAAHRGAVAQPQLVGRGRAEAALEARARPPARGGRGDRAGREAGCDHGLDAARARHPGPSAAWRRSRPSPSPTAAGADSATASSLRVVEDLGDQARARPCGIAVIDAVDVGQEHQQPRLQHQRDVGGQRIVVAEGDLVGRGRVVLVHDRARRPTTSAGAACGGRSRTRAAVDVGLGQEHLAGVQAVAGKRAAPSAAAAASGRAPRRPAGRPAPAGGWSCRARRGPGRPRRS